MDSECDIHNHLEKIRYQLWQKNATLMVGSGFSKNAKRKFETTPCPPNWGELIDKVIDELYNSYDENKRKKYRENKDFMKIAEEYENTFSRDKLINLLKKLIPDDELMPSQLHIKLLSLPWVDIFTTNYDSLLEKTANIIDDYNYSVVKRIIDIPLSKHPCIFKLHGSFDLDNSSLIISSEDYRKYPQDYAPFVNSVRQAIMQNTMCLIGFSGQDPNFNSWLGWVKDYFKEDMRPIYLIGLLDLPKSEHETLVKKNIIPIELSKWEECSSSDYSEALDNFLDFMSKNPDDDLYIQPSTKFYAPSIEISVKEKIELIEYWKEERQNYSKRLFLSWKKRSNIQIFTERWTYDLDDCLKNLPEPWDIKGLYELNCRLEICLMPIFNNLIDYYEKIISKYERIFSNNQDIKCQDELKEIWLKLCFAVLRWSREELNDEIWNRYETRILNHIDFKSEFLNQLYYERVSYAMTILDLKNVEENIKLWENINIPLIWKIKFISFLMDLGNIDKAYQLYNEVFKEIQHKIKEEKINIYLVLKDVF